MIKECDEEASLNEAFVRKYMKYVMSIDLFEAILTVRQTGAVTYFYITEDGWLQPGESYWHVLQC
jgi:hypothetical protein